MPFKILKKEILSESIVLFDVEARDIAKKTKPGNFIVVRANEQAERIPLTIADFNIAEGTIALVIQDVGKSTHDLNKLNEGDAILDIMGPLGKPSRIEKFGKVVCVAGGLGIAPMYPIARALTEAGNEVYSILGARTKGLLFWEQKMRDISGRLTVTTDDGSHGVKALVTGPLEEFLKENPDTALVVAIGPPVMMKFVSQVTKKYNVKTTVSLNSIMVDGTGMCGGCRVRIGGKQKFCCVDGPEFDGHEVDFDLFTARHRCYHEEEKEAMELCRKNSEQCRP